MKFKKLLGGGLLAAVLALGVGAGLAVRSESKETDAANGSLDSHTIYCAIRTTTLGSYTLKINSHCENGSTQYWKQETMVDLNDTSTYPGYKVFQGVYYETWSGLNNLQFQLYEGETHKGQKEPISTWTSGSWEGKLFKYDDEQWVESYTPPIPTYTVSEYAVVDGVPETNPFHEVPNVLEGSVFAKPNNPVRVGYHFEGWYTTVDCQTEYAPITVTGNFSIYAKFTTLVVDSYFYWTSKDSGDLERNGRVHFWGEYEADVLLSDCENSLVLKMWNQDGHIYKIPAPSKADFQMIIMGETTGGESVQTYDKTVTLGALHFTWWDSTYSKYDMDGGNVNAGLALDFLFAAETKRNAATYKTLNYSVCGISKDDADKLIKAYDKLDGDVQEIIDGTYVYTYDPSKSAEEQEASTSQTNIAYSLIVAKLREIANGTEPNLNTRSISLFGDIDNSTPIMLVVIISVVSLTAVGGYIFLKRRKEN